MSSAWERLDTGPPPPLLELSTLAERDWFGDKLCLSLSLISLGETFKVKEVSVKSLFNYSFYMYL